MKNDYPALVGKRSDREIGRAILDGNRKGMSALEKKYFPKIKYSVRSHPYYRRMRKNGVLFGGDYEDVAIVILRYVAEKMQKEWIRINPTKYYRSFIHKVLTQFYRKSLRKKFKGIVSIDDYRIMDDGSVVSVKDSIENPKPIDEDFAALVIAAVHEYRKHVRKPIHYLFVCFQFVENCTNEFIAETTGYSKGRVTQVTKKFVREFVPKFIEPYIAVLGDFYSDGLRQLLRETT